MIGTLINTVPVLVHVGQSELASDCLKAVHAFSTDMIDHAHCSLSDIQRWIGKTELFDTIVAFENYPPSQLQLSDIATPVRIDVTSGHEFVDTTVCVAISPEAGDLYQVKTTFKCADVSEEMVQRMTDRFAHILAMLATPTSCHQVVAETSAAPANEANFIALSSCGTHVALPYELLHHAFEERVRECPGLSAVEYGPASLSYGDLNDQANVLAVKLTELGVHVGSRVAVIMERCLEFPIGLLATLKAGASMVPLDATFPPERLRYVLADARVSVVVTTNDHIGHVRAIEHDIPVVSITSKELAQSGACFEPRPAQVATPLDEAYVVYTSGSTGKPKGVPVQHAGAVNVMVHSAAAVGIVRHARVMQFMAVSFDGFQMDMWKCLSHGATLVLRDTGFMDTLVHSIDAFACTPTALAQLGDPRQYSRVKVVSVGGESCPGALKDLWAPHVRFMNLYGPSECAIMTHCAQLHADAPITIGRPLENVRSYILDNDQRPVPVGVVGELYLGGMCVSPGYINLPDETAVSFVPDPFVSGHPKMFRTGDLGRLRPDGTFELLGRQDTQVKLKGYRIELDEVAGAMLHHPDVVSAAVLVKDKTHLVGYFAPATVSVDSLQRVVAAHLPVYMVPAAWVGVAVMPQNSNGKIDKNALALLDVESAVEALATASEKRMAQIWSDVLGVSLHDIGRRTSFFALGGDSMSAIHVAATCRHGGFDLMVSDFLKSPELCQAAELAERSAGRTFPVAQVETAVLVGGLKDWGTQLNLAQHGVYLATSLQASMIFATLSRRDAYVFQHHMQLTSTLHAARVLSAFERLARVHDILRTTFVNLPSGVHGVVHADFDRFPVIHTAANSIHEFLESDRRRGFEVGDGNFSRLSIVELPTATFSVLTMHHAVYDGWTIAMLLRDLHNVLHGVPLVPRPSFCRVIDFIQAQDKRETERFWRAYLKGVTCHSLNLTTSSTASNVPTTSPSSVSITLDVNEIRAAARRVGLTLAEFTRLVWALTLRKYMRHNDVVFGHVLSNRNIPVVDVTRILGAMISTVPCRVTFDGTDSVHSGIACIRAERGVVVDHSYASQADIKRWSGVDGALFDTVLAFQQLPELVDFGDGCATNLITAPHAVEHTLELTIWPIDTDLTVVARYEPTRISNDQVQQILREFRHTTIQLCTLSCDTDDLPAAWNVSNEQADFIHLASHGPQVPLPHELLQHSFEKRALSHPTAPAIEFRGVTLTYGELNEHANVMAAQLCTMGVCVGHRVGVLMDRCLEFPMALLAVVKAGASMMPLDVAFPASRIKYMLADANVSLVVTTGEHRDVVESFRLDVPLLQAAISESPAHVHRVHSKSTATSTDEAYVVYTSGSMGKPKGVPVTHAAAVNVIHFQSSATGFVPGHRVMQFMAIGFDGFQWDLWKALSSGATLVLRSHDFTADIKSVQAITCTPTALAQLGHPTEYPNLVVVSVAGESCPGALKDLWAPHVRFMNLYGPSECAIMTHCAQLHADAPITIGRPLENVRSYILDNDQRPVPVGVVGELYLGGMCVSPGYINLPDETAVSFVPDPFVSGHPKMFRTGDLGRLRPDGTFELLGRQDTQVKLKGYRIELDEVAGAMLHHPDVVSAAVLVKDKTHLVGYFAPATVSVDSLQRVVAAHLPVYMVPAAWVGVAVMPQNSNGKIDKNALALLDVESAVEALATASEKRMAQIWSDVLGVSLHDI
ncbi:hypothetical protein DYB32_009661, partial [Aphanomyces invadans]